MSDTVEIIIKTRDESTKQTKGINSGFKDLTKTVGQFIGVATGAAVTLKKFFDVGEKGAQFNVMSQSAKQFGIDIVSLQNSVDGTIDKFSLMNGTLTLLAGTQGELKSALTDSSDELLKIAKAANAVNPALGDTSFLYESLGRGIKRASPLILDNLGLTIKVGEANQKYADQLGKTVDELTAEEKQMALLNETLRAGNVLVEQASNINTENLDSIQRMKAAFSDLGNEIMQRLAPSLATAADGITLIIKRGEILGDMFDKTAKRVTKNAKTYDEYTDQMLEAAVAAKQLTEGEARLIREQGLGYALAKNYADEIGLLSEEMWRHTQVVQENIDYGDMWLNQLNDAASMTQEAADAQDELNRSLDDANTSIADQIAGWKEDIKWIELGGLAIQEAAEKIKQDYDKNVIDATTATDLLNDQIYEAILITAQMNEMSLEELQQEFEEAGLDAGTAALYADTLYKNIEKLDGMSADIYFNINTIGSIPNISGAAASIGQPGMEADLFMSGGLNAMGQATGGPLANVALVGERGQELIINGVVIPHDLTQRLLGLGLSPGAGFLMGGSLDDDYLHPVSGNTITPTTPTYLTTGSGGGGGGGGAAASASVQANEVGSVVAEQLMPVQSSVQSQNVIVQEQMHFQARQQRELISKIDTMIAILRQSPTQIGDNVSGSLFGTDARFGDTVS